MHRFLPVVLVALASAPAALAAGPYDGLLTAVPPQANTLVLVDVKAAYASPLAKAEKWADDVHRRYKSGVGFVSPDAEAVVIASHVNLSALTRDHQIGLVKVLALPTMAGLAAREGGPTSRIGDQTFVLSPRDVYLTTLGGSTVAAVHPADRQAAARWVRYAAKSKSVELSPYLKAAADAAGGNTLTVAVDLADVVDPALLAVGLTASPAVVNQKGVDVGRVARFVATVRGLTFTAKVTDAITGTVRVDFAEDPAPVKKILRELFLEVLDDQGAAVPGIEQWETTYGPRSMTLAGPMTTTDLRRVMSLFAFPGVTGEDDPKLSPGEVSEAATRRYWGAVNAVLTDLRGTKDSKDYAKTATWHDKAASQLDHLHARGVDPVAVEAARGAAGRLRAIASSLRGVPIDVEAVGRKGYYHSQPSYGVGVGWWGIRPVWYGSGQVSTNLPQVRAEQAKVVADDQKRRVEVWAQIDQLLSDARRKLADKYKDGF